MQIAKEVLQIAEILKQAGYEAYLVGGCLRDVLLGATPKDWDLATSAKPEEILKLFPDSVYENRFGTVGVKTRSEDPLVKVVEVTTFRLEGTYTDKRHPDEVKFAKTIEEDLARRDFTVNAMALNLGSEKKSKKDLIDPFGGQEDLKNEVLRAVGEADKRFNEDALRLMRAVRFSAQLGFDIEPETELSVKKHAGLLEFVSKERIRDEFNKLLITERGHEGVELMRELGLLTHVIPELLEGVEMEQNQHHIFSVYEHNLRSLQYAVEQKFPLDLRLASLLHDVGKPKSRQWKDTPTGKKIRSIPVTRHSEPRQMASELREESDAYSRHPERSEGSVTIDPSASLRMTERRGDWTFYGHQVIGAKQATAILQRLKYPNDVIEKVSLLVYEHMFVYDPEAVTLAGVRRLVSRVGTDNMDALIKVREADRIGSGVPKAQPYRLRYLQAMVEKVKMDPISAKMIAVKGDEVIKAAGITPGPGIGAIIAILLEEVLDDPERNEKELLLARVKELAKLPVKELVKMSQKSKERAAGEQEKIDKEIKKKYFVG